MKLMCMFDLPTDSQVEKREYTQFRKHLIANGFVMIQYSVYLRTCLNREHAKRLSEKIEKSVPLSGNVRLLAITEKQYDDMKIVLGRKRVNEQTLQKERIIII